MVGCVHISGTYLGAGCGVRGKCSIFWFLTPEFCAKCFGPWANRMIALVRLAQKPGAQANRPKHERRDEQDKGQQWYRR